MPWTLLCFSYVLVLCFKILHLFEHFLYLLAVCGGSRGDSFLTMIPAFCNRKVLNYLGLWSVVVDETLRIELFWPQKLSLYLWVATFKFWSIAWAISWPVYWASLTLLYIMLALTFYIWVLNFVDQTVYWLLINLLRFIAFIRLLCTKEILFYLTVLLHSFLTEKFRRTYLW